jgi:soluble lytic murein transglycosylase-like protein
VIMQDRTTPSTDCSSSYPDLIFPYRSGPNDAEYSPALQRAGQTCASTGPIKRFHRRWSFARSVAAIAPIVVQIVAPTGFPTSVHAQTATRSETIDRYAEFIAEASTRFAVPARWIRAVMQIESGGDQRATSPRGAFGLMQLMPNTWVELSARYGLGHDPFDVRENIFAGAAYLKEMHERFGTAGFLAAYHAGPWRYEQHLVTGKPLPSETTAYVAAVTPLLDKEHGERAAVDGRRALSWRGASLFVERTGAR